MLPKSFTLICSDYLDGKSSLVCVYSVHLSNFGLYGKVKFFLQKDTFTNTED